jgi:adenylate cyclase
VILSWKCEASEVYKNAVLLFFDFREKISKHSGHYLKKYGFLPEFKAGINAGMITVAEVGVKKKEIAYHGDAINTTSRIQEQCNRLNHMLLCSENIINELRDSNLFRAVFVDEFIPRGKRIPVRVYSIEQR